MENTIKITNVTITENSVVISLERYENLIEIEKTKTRYIKNGVFFNKTVITDDEAVKELTNELQESYNLNEKLNQTISELNTEINQLKGVKIQKKEDSWFKKLFK